MSVAVEGDRENLTTSHRERINVALAHAYEAIPFYKKRRPPAVGSGAPDALAGLSLPLLWKQDIRTALPREWVPEGRDVRAELASGQIELVETSGSTTERTRILWDKGWWLRQEERGMRTNALVDRAMGDAGRYREAILTTPVCGLGACHAGDLSFEERLDEHRVFLNVRADPTFWKPEDLDRMLDELARHRTVGLESDPAYLAALARHATAKGRRLEVADFVTLTYAMTSAAHLSAIRPALTAPCLQLYGASEVGVLYMQGDDDLLHHCPVTTHVELLPVTVRTPGATDVAVVVVTTLDKTVQPLLRFVIGDLVQMAPSGPRRYSPVAPIHSLEGRFQDALIRPDGAWVTAGSLDRAVGAVRGIQSYQANQPSPASVTIDIVSDRDAPVSLLDDARERVAPLLAPLDVTLRLSTGIACEGSGKFRLSRRHFTVDLGTLFEDGAGRMA